MKGILLVIIPTPILQSDSSMPPKRKAAPKPKLPAKPAKRKPTNDDGCVIDTAHLPRISSSLTMAELREECHFRGLPKSA